VVAGDPAVCDASRVMRLPGSHNTKDEAWIPVQVLSRRRGRYTLEQLEEWLASAQPVLHRRISEKLRKVSVGKLPNNPWAAFADAHTCKAPVDIEQRLAEMHYRGPDDRGIHLTQLSVTAAMLNRGYSIEETVARVLQATIAAAGAAALHWNWRTEEQDLQRMCRSWLAKHPQVFFEVSE
jgi:hypothetical protein